MINLVKKKMKSAVKVCIQAIYLITVISCLVVGAVASAVTDSVAMFLLMAVMLAVLTCTASYTVLTIFPDMFHEKMPGKMV